MKFRFRVNRSFSIENLFIWQIDFECVTFCSEYIQLTAKHMTNYGSLCARIHNISVSKYRPPSDVIYLCDFICIVWIVLFSLLLLFFSLFEKPKHKQVLFFFEIQTLFGSSLRLFIQIQWWTSTIANMQMQLNFSVYLGFLCVFMFFFAHLMKLQQTEIKSNSVDFFHSFVFFYSIAISLLIKAI